MEWQHLKALLVEVLHEALLQLIDVAPTRQEDEDRARFLIITRRLRLLVHPVDVQDKSLDDGEVEGEAALLQHVMLPEAIQEAGLVHGRHHLILEAMVSKAPEHFLVFRLRVLEHHLLPGSLVPVSLCAGRNADAPAKDSRAKPRPEVRLLVQSGNHLIQVELAHREDTPWHSHLCCALEVPFEGLHLQCGAHEHEPQVFATL
mmetsp:Transcript_61202/g.131628  ORF Transcript_61202/g.131628 Transcript_61202/m.131628 type:complete len:203 (+) Transcript_61202:1454-2062(+)